nr:MAG: hypothetical protein 3 [Guangxi cystovirus 4]QYF49804.1 MAG: hypothetical protein 3 [Guangxi cystovirus 18]
MQNQIDVSKTFLFGKPQAGSFSYPADSTQHQAVRVSHTIVDRYAGASVVETICGKEPNIGVIAHHLKKRNVRKQVADFFITNKVVEIIESVVSTQTVKENEAQTTIDAVIKAIAAVVKDTSVRAIVTEFVVALARTRGLVAGTTEITQILEYEKKPVSIDDLSMELAAQSAAVEFKANVTGKFFQKSMAKKAYAQAFAEALRSVGFELHSARNVQHILDDIVKGVYVHLMAASHPETLGAIDDSWLKSPVVEELAACLPFITSALDLDKKNPGIRNLKPKNDLYTLDREAPAVLAKIKGSRRYAFVSRDEFLATYGKISVKDLDGTPMFFVMYEEAGVQPVAQALNVFEDAVLPGVAKSVLAAEEYVTKYIASSLPGGESVKLSYHANRILNTLQHAVESGDVRIRFPVVVDHDNDEKRPTLLSENIGLFMALEEEDAADAVRRDIAWMYADEVLLSYDSDMNEVTPVYRVKTDVKKFPEFEWNAGLTPDGFYVTQDVGAVFLLGRDLSPKGHVIPKSQLISSDAIGTRVLGLDDDADRLVSETDVPFSVSIGGSRVSGRMTTFDVGLQDMSEYTVFVKALHNEKVVSAISRSYQFLEALERDLNVMASHPVDDASYSDWGQVTVTHQLVAFMQQARVQSLVEMARDVSAQYRTVVRSIMQMAAMRDLKPEEVYRLRGVLKQKSFEVYSDLIALQMVLQTCGLDASFVEDALKSKELTNVVLRVA